MKQRAGALLYALFILIAVGTLLTLIMFLFSTSKMFTHKYSQNHKLIYNLNSGLNILLDKQPVCRIGEEVVIDLYGNEKDSVILKRQQWGLFEVVGCTAFDANKSVSKFALLVNEDLKKKNKFYLTDNNSPLALAGNTELYGECFLPKKGIERAYIQGLSYSGAKLIYGSKHTSNKNLPALAKQILENKTIKNIVLFDSVISFSTSQFQINNSFKNKTLILEEDNGIYLNNSSYSGNIKIRSNREVFISNSTYLDQTIVQAPYIEIEDGFQGVCQIFATDSIKIGNNVKLEYPSFVVLLSENSKNPNVFIGKDFHLEGGLIAYLEHKTIKNSMQVTLAQGTSIKGVLYCNGYTQLEGELTGKIYTDKLFVKKPATTYVNHLINVVVNKETLSSHFLEVSILEDSKSKRSIVNWVR